MPHQAMPHRAMPYRFASYLFPSHPLTSCRRVLAVLVAVLSVCMVPIVLSVAASAQSPGARPGTVTPADPERGAAIAKRWCATCHVTSEDQTQASDEATPFPALARRNAFDAAALALFLLDPHPRMPDMNLTRAEANDLAAYVRSLAPK
ncbi:c-type cytochrome [Rhodoplanes azumiensis]|uniref:C-type cytochrome n=1 Tax=Rhodoplanes azumiensis TaxID=1897628 RepID=A0ABW5ADY8_9BRAD